MSSNPAPRITLADLIMEKITEKQTEIRSKLSEADSKTFYCTNILIEDQKIYQKV